MFFVSLIVVIMSSASPLLASSAKIYPVEPVTEFSCQYFFKEVRGRQVPFKGDRICIHGTVYPNQAFHAYGRQLKNSSQERATLYSFVIDDKPGSQEEDPFICDNYSGNSPIYPIYVAVVNELDIAWDLGLGEGPYCRIVFGPEPMFWGEGE